MHWLNNLGPKEIVIGIAILAVVYLFWRGMGKSSQGPSYDQRGHRPFGGQNNGPQGPQNMHQNNQQYNQQNGYNQQNNYNQQNGYNSQNNGYNNQQNNGYNQQGNGYNNQQNNGYR